MAKPTINHYSGKGVIANLFGKPLPHTLPESQIDIDQYWMSLALDMAKKAAECGEVPVGALIVKGEEVIASASNQPITTHDACAHAEILAIRAAGEFLQNYRLVDCTLYVTLEPCTMCFGAMVHSRISRLVYGASEPKAGVVVSQLQLSDQTFFNHYFDIVGGVLGASCSKALSDFFAKRRVDKKRQKLAKPES